MSQIRVRSVIACDDIRTEMDGKLILIGVVNPIFGFERGADDVASALRLSFLLTIDVPAAGDYELTFRARSLTSTQGRTVKLGVSFFQAADQIPFPTGPFVFPITPTEKGFKFQQQTEGRWRTLAEWRLETEPSD